MVSVTATGATRLLEREAELEILGELISEAAAGAGRVAIVEGPPGIGKTELLDAAGRLAREAGVLELTARGSELERDFPFGVARQLFEQALGALDAQEHREALAGDAALSARLVGAEGLATVPSPGSPELFPLLHGLYWLCSNLSASRPLLLAVDDGHWADAPSLKFLHYLARRLEELPILVAIAARSTHPEAPVPLVEAIRPEPLVRTLRLDALSPSASRELVASVFDTPPDSEFAQACHETSGGNPFLLTELAGSLAADRIRPAAAAAAEIRDVRSEVISRHVLVRLSRLGEGPRAVARATAILGSGAETRHVAGLAALPEDETMAALDSLVEARVLAPGRPLRFLHPLLRNAVYTDLPEGRRAAEHKRAARVLADDGANPDRVAGHLIHAEPLADDWVVEALREAARWAIGRGAPEEAATFLWRALREPPSDRAQVLIELGAATARAGDPQAPDLLRGALSQTDRQEQRVHAVVELGMDLANAGRLEEAAVEVRRVLAALDPDNKELVRPLEMMVLVMSECSVFARPVGTDLLERAERVVDRRGDSAPRGLLAIVAFERALVSGTAAEAAALAEQALAGGRLLVEQPVDSAHTYFATAALAMGDSIRAADRHLADAIAESRARGSLRGSAFAAAMRALLRHQLGDLGGAEHDARIFFELETDANWNVYRLAAASALADTLLDRGDIDGAAEALADVGRDVDHLLSLPFRASRARLMLARREPALALAEVERCAKWERDWGVRNPVWCDWRELAVLAHMLDGDHEAAERLAEEQLRLVRDFGSHRALGRALRTAGLVAGGDEGIDLLTEATEELERSEATLDHARALADLGGALRRAKHRVDSREPLRRAIDVARRCGALPLAERAREELRATGARPRRLMLSGIESLTAREEQVARIACDGLTNREIAQQLFVSKKTVETHLGSIYRKLDVSSREQLAEALQATSGDPAA